MNPAAEAKLKEAVEIYAERWMNTFPSEKELESQVTFSPKFEAKMETLIKRQKKPYYRLINTSLKRAAAIVIIVVVSLSAVMSVEAIRTPVVKFFVEMYERFSSVVFHVDGADSGTVPSFIETVYYPSYLPEGYAIEDEETEEFITFHAYRFSDGAGKDILFSQYVLNDPSITINTEGTQSHEILIQGYEAVFYENLGMYGLWWSNGDYIFSLESNIQDYDKFIAVAESVQQKGVLF